MENNEYVLGLEFDENTNPYELFLDFTNMLKGFEDFNEIISGSFIKTTPEIKSILMDVEKGSLRLFFADVLDSIDDEKMEDKPVRALIGSFAVKAKYKTLDYLRKTDKKQISNDIIVDIVTEEVQQLSHELSDGLLPDYNFNIDKTELLEAVDSITKNGNAEHFYMEVKEAKTTIPRIEFFKQDDKELNKENNTTRQTLTIKIADLLGTRKWTFKYLGKTIEAKVLDNDWLEQLHTNNILIGTNYKISVDLLQINYFDDNGEYISSDYEVIKIHETIKPKAQKEIKYD